MSNSFAWGKCALHPMNFDDAIRWCDLQGGHLPEDMNLFSAHSEDEPGFELGAYWSKSPGFSEGRIWVWNFEIGTAEDRNKDDLCFVRCVFDE